MSSQAVIIGGGLAGSAAAITLAQAGCDVLLLERESQPHHKVCGEFLSQEALGSLTALGLDLSGLGAAGIHSLRLADATRVTSTPLPFPAMSLTRCRLDEALIQRAADAGVHVMRGARVLNVCREGGLWRIALDSADSILAKDVFVATGKHDLPGHPRPPGRQPNFVGLKLHLQLAPQQTAELEGHIELMLFRGGYAGLSCVEGDAVNLGWIAHRDELRKAGSPRALLQSMQQQCPHLARRLQGGLLQADRPLAISPIPYGYVRPVTSSALWWLGDQAAVIPSFTGDGMSIALHSGRLAAAMYLSGKDALKYQQTLARQLRRQVAVATALSRGLIWPPSRSAMLLATRLWPSSMSLAAHMTRIPASARSQIAVKPL
jgi:flavin-dependent dehydrogenase